MTLRWASLTYLSLNTSFQSLGVATTASGIATIATGGLALPVVAGLGAVVGVGGGVWNFLGSQKKDKMEQAILKQITDIVEEDKLVQEEVRTQMARFQILDDTQRNAAGEQIMAIIRGWGGVALNFGPDAALNVLLICLVPLSTFFTGIPVVMAALGAIGQGGQAVVQSITKEVADDVLRAAVEKAGKTLPNNWTRKYIVDNALGELSKRGGKTYVSLTAEGVKELADDAALVVAKEAANISKIVGGITAGMGVISCVWDGYQISQAWQGSKEGSETKLGEALRRIAKEESKIRNRA